MSDPVNAGMLAAVAVATPLGERAGSAEAAVVAAPAAVTPAPATANVAERESSLQVPVVGLFVLVLIAAIYLGRPVLMPVMLGAILALVLSPVVGRLTILRMPEPVAAAVVMATLVAAVVVIGELLVTPAREVLSEVPAQVQSLFNLMIDWLRSFRLGAWVAPKGNAQLSEHAAAQGVSIGAVLLRTAQSFLVSAVSAGLVAYFLLASGDLFLVKLMRVLPRVRDKVRAVTVVRTVQQEVARYFASVAIINIGLGVATTLLIPHNKLMTNGAAAHRSLAYLAHGSPLADGGTTISPIFGEAFGDIYDLSTAFILCLAGVSVTLSLQTLLPHYLNRLGMDVTWAGNSGVIMHVLNVIILLVTVVFRASPSLQQWAYATSVLVLLTGAGNGEASQRHHQLAGVDTPGPHPRRVGRRGSAHDGQSAVRVIEG